MKKEFVKPVCKVVALETCALLSCSSMDQSRNQKVFFDEVHDPGWGYYGYGDESIGEGDEIL